MELEHTNLGCHCEVDDCNQRDFLPFTCNVCSKKFCLLHRTYAAHSCIGAASKDMTSLDCPICLKSIRFAKSDSPDAVWNDHFMNACSQEASDVRQIEKCYKPSCNLRLGPSNTIVCKSCRQKVCMAHRLPEEHQCLGMRGAILSKLPPTVAQIPSAARASVATTSKSATNPKPATTGTSSITAATKGPSSTAATQKASAPVSATIPSSSAREVVSNQYVCPFCSRSFQQSVQLESHVANEHPDPGVSAPLPVPPPSTHTTQLSSSSSASMPPQSSSLVSGVGAVGREVCPLCQARFVDPVDLVTHYEQVHPGAGGTGNQGSSSDCIIC